MSPIQMHLIIILKLVFHEKSGYRFMSESFFRNRIHFDFFTSNCHP